jgi:PAS fold
MQNASERSAVLQQRVRSLLDDEYESSRECDIGYWDCNKVEGLSWSAHMFKLFDVKPKTAKIDVDADFFSAVHPEDVSDLRALLKAATRDGGRFTTQYRVVWKDNTVLYIKACGGQFMNSDGSIFPGRHVCQHHTPETVASSRCGADAARAGSVQKFVEARGKLQCHQDRCL